MKEININFCIYFGLFMKRNKKYTTKIQNIIDKLQINDIICTRKLSETSQKINITGGDLEWQKSELV